MLKIKLLLFLIWEFQYSMGLNDIDNIKIVKVIDTYILKLDNFVDNPTLIYDLGLWIFKYRK